MDDYEYLSVYRQDNSFIRFDECKAFIAPSRVLIVAVGAAIYSWNADCWSRIEGKRLTAP